MKSRICALALALVLIIVLALPVSAAKNEYVIDESSKKNISSETDDEIFRLVDEADLLSASEEKKLLKKLDDTSKSLEFDIIVVTMEDFGGGDIEAFTEDYYDDVYGKNRDGVILLISMENRDWCISGNGEGKDIFTSSNIRLYTNSYFLALTPFL